MKKEVCIRCGKCCAELCATFGATNEDIKRWKKEGRNDILELIDDFTQDVWITTEGAEAYGRCPWLRKVNNQNIYSCRLQKTKPEVCRQYPQQGRKCLKDKDIKIPRSTDWL